MKLYNSLTKKTETFKPIESIVRMYSCGPTVYDHAHIGNLSSFIYTDTLRRALRLAGHQVQHVMNFTDVDDRTIERSKQQYADDPPRKALEQLTRHYEDVFKQNMHSIGNDISELQFIRATESIDKMQALILKLHECGVAYLADDGIYFSLNAYQKQGGRYGQLSDIALSKDLSARISNDDYDKEQARDFALWKKQREDEPSWDFMIDGTNIAGRPGWHIECSAMSVARLGQPFDIHTGGVDLIFPHHENEIAQSTACQLDKEYARVFFHNEHLLVDGKKMSKRLNNFYTMADIEEKGYDPLSFRLLILQSHYQSRTNFTWKSLKAAQNKLISLRNLAALKYQLGEDTSQNQTLSTDPIAKAMFDNLDTPSAIKHVNHIESVLEDTKPHELARDGITALIHDLDDIFGLQLAMVDDISGEQKEMIDQREAARNDKDFERADRIRDTLLEHNIGLRDYPNGVIWYRTK